ncbi:LysR family transcriptional regulator [Sneathiella glossodoripedis]|uniref:LysR family transcriptional regulator n=1 Tax=Sneathiella glossodoripedis TaxID=418853 RepID=UPI00046EDE6C|nr:LysR family transcriptional regulator [Sneathiella glossodoripedis]
MNFANFDLNLMRVLDVMLREKSTVRTAKKLNMSQSSVSGALGRLRHALNDELFVRQGNRLVPTEYAKSLEFRLREEIERLEMLFMPPVVFDPKTWSGVYRISASDFFAEMLMPPLADLLRKEAPGVKVQLVDLVPDSYVDSLEKYSADIALVPDQATPDWVDRAELFYSSFAVIARTNHSLLNELKEGEVVPLDLFCELGHVLFSPEGNFAAMGDAALAAVGKERQVIMTLPVFSGVCRAVAESDLIALVPRQLAEKMAPQVGLSLYQPPMEIPTPLIVALWHRRHRNSPFHGWMRSQIIGLMRPLNSGEKLAIKE